MNPTETQLRVEALSQALQLSVSGNIPASEVKTYAETFFQFIKGESKS